MRSYAFRWSIEGALRRKTFLGLPDFVCTVVLIDEIPEPGVRRGSALNGIPGSLLLELILTEVWLPAIGMLDDGGTFGAGDSAFVLLCLFLEKNEVDCEGSFEELEAEDVMEVFRIRLVGSLSFCSSLSGCFADRNPNVPREAIVAAGFASHSIRQF